MNEIKNEVMDNLTLGTRNNEGDFESLADFLIENHMGAVEKFIDEDRNNGLLFEICGFDGKSQNEHFDFFVDMFGVEVF